MGVKSLLKSLLLEDDAYESLADLVEKHVRRCEVVGLLVECYGGMALCLVQSSMAGMASTSNDVYCMVLV